MQLAVIAVILDYMVLCRLPAHTLSVIYSLYITATYKARCEILILRTVRNNAYHYKRRAALGCLRENLEH